MDAPNSRRVNTAPMDRTTIISDTDTGEYLWTGINLPERQRKAIDLANNRILAASPEAWRFLGWRWTDPATGRIRILPAEFFGPLPR